VSFLNKLLGGGDVVRAVGEGLDNLVTSDEERLEKQLELMKAEREFDYLEAKLLADQNIAQTEVNKEEARSGNMFVAGWRPAIGWIGALTLFYQFIAYPLLLWLPIEKPPEPMDSSMLYTIITGMLGIAGLRSFDKLKQTDTRGLNVFKTGS
jgi:hypothetical protein